jgi:hypothetical protein
VHVRRRLMQASPQALPLLQVRQQDRGSSAGLAGLAGSGRGGSLRAGFSGLCCAIASPTGAATSISTTNNTYLVLLTISGRYPRRSVSGSDFNAGACGQARSSPRRLDDRRRRGYSRTGDAIVIPSRSVGAHRICRISCI